MRGRSRVLALLVAFAFVFVGLPATAYAGSSDELALPPGPSCAEPVFTTTPVIADDGQNLSDPHLGDGAGGLATSFSFPVDLGAGTVSLDEIITWDAHVNRETNLDQTNERVVVGFSLDGAPVATSGPTTDLVDGPVSAWEIDNLGTLALPAGADTITVSHAGGTAAINSIVVTSICFTFVADAPVEPEPEPACDDDPATPEPAEGCPEPEPEPACDDDPATPEPAEGCPEPPEASCEDGSPDPDCDLEPEPACDDDPATPEPAEGCPEPEPEPEPAVCDDDPSTPEPADGCDVLPEPEPEPEPEPGDQAPELAVTGAYSGNMAAGAMILVILGGSAAFVAHRNED